MERLPPVVSPQVLDPEGLAALIRKLLRLFEAKLKTEEAIQDCKVIKAVPSSRKR